MILVPNKVHLILKITNCFVKRKAKKFVQNTLHAANPSTLLKIDFSGKGWSFQNDHVDKR